MLKSTLPTNVKHTVKMQWEESVKAKQSMISLKLCQLWSLKGMFKFAVLIFFTGLKNQNLGRMLHYH
jgi:hypothetical protein